MEQEQRRPQIILTAFFKYVGQEHSVTTFSLFRFRTNITPLRSPSPSLPQPAPADSRCSSADPFCLADS